VTLFSVQDFPGVVRGIGNGFQFSGFRFQSSITHRQQNAPAIMDSAAQPTGKAETRSATEMPAHCCVSFLRKLGIAWPAPLMADRNVDRELSYTTNGMKQMKSQTKNLGKCRLRTTTISRESHPYSVWCVFLLLLNNLASAYSLHVMNKHAQALGRIKSAKKAASSRRNGAMPCHSGKHRGRPRKAKKEKRKAALPCTSHTAENCV
jgi:hypothetical protein